MADVKKIHFVIKGQRSILSRYGKWYYFVSVRTLEDGYWHYERGFVGSWGDCMRYVNGRLANAK